MLALTPTASPAQDAVQLASVFDNENNRKLSWNLDAEEFEKLPKFDDLTKDPPLDLKRAIKVALEECQKKYPGKHIDLDSVSLRQPVRFELRRQIFFYFVTFQVAAGKELPNQFDVLVLPNGKILTPDEKPLAN